MNDIALPGVRIGMVEASVGRSSAFERGIIHQDRPAWALSGNAASRLRCGVEHVCAPEGRTVAPEDFEIIGQLLLRAGMIMEDRTTELITRLDPGEQCIVERVEVVITTGLDLLALAAAAQTILRSS